MNNKNLGATNWTALAVIALIIMGGVAFTMLKPQSGTTSNPQTNTQNNSSNMNMAMTTVEVALSAQNNSGQSGTATLTDFNAKTKVVINVTPGPKGVAQPAHIHAGDCTTLGGIKYNLNDVIDGHSETILEPALHFIHGLGQTAINIHKSAAESKIYTSCGDLTKALNSAMGM